MSETLARLLAAELGMVAYQSGGNLWLVKGKDRQGNLVVISTEGVAVYADEEAFAAGDNQQGIWFDS